MFTEKTKKNIETIAKNVSTGLTEIAITGAISYTVYEYHSEIINYLSGLVKHVLSHGHGGLVILGANSVPPLMAVGAGVGIFCDGVYRTFLPIKYNEKYQQELKSENSQPSA